MLDRSPLKSFPWASLGRREDISEVAKKCADQKSRVHLLSGTPLISLIVSVSPDVALESFEQTWAALATASYPKWEVVFVASSEVPKLQAIVAREKETRTQWITVEGADDAALKNAGVAKATGDWLGFVDAGDVLSPSALYQLVLELRSRPDSDLLYTNEAQLDSDSRRIARFFSKPEFSWFNLVHFNPVGKFWMVRTSRFHELQGFRASAKASHEHDFLLRLSEKTQAWSLLPFFLYYRRQACWETKDADELKAIVETHLREKKFAATARIEERASRRFLKVKPALKHPESHLVSAIICFRDRADWTIRSLNALLRQVGQTPIEVFLVNNQSRPEELAKVRKAIAPFPHDIRIINYDSPFNFAHMHNSVAREYARGKYLLLLNNDVFWSGERTLDELVAWAALDWVGTVGVLLRYDHGAVQHAGFRAHFGGVARMARVGHVQSEDTFAHQSREVFGNTFAACLFKRSTFEQLGGLRELDLPNGFGDVAFNFECLRQGLKNLYLGHVEGVHLESASRGSEYEYWEEFHIEREYPGILQQMLRVDAGYNRVPASDLSLSTFLQQTVMTQLREKAPWLQPLKPAVEKIRRALRSRRLLEDKP